MKISVDGKWCKGCGLCVRACPKGVLAIAPARDAAMEAI